MFAALGFPSTHDEQWRYTNLAPLARTPFALPPDEVALAERTAGAQAGARLGRSGSRLEPRLVVRERTASTPPLSATPPPGSSSNAMGTPPRGVRRSPSSTPSRSGAGPIREASFAARSTPFSSTASGSPSPPAPPSEDPIFILHVATPPAPRKRPEWCTRANFFTFEENSSATVIETYLGAGGPSFRNTRTDVSLARAPASITSSSSSRARRRSTSGTSRSRTPPGATSASHVFSFGGKLVRNELAMDLAGEGRENRARRPLLRELRPARRLPHAHRPRAARATASSSTRASSTGTAAASSTARSSCVPEPRETDARQTNRNLILSDSALVDSKPQLEIHNNDVTLLARLHDGTPRRGRRLLSPLARPRRPRRRAPSSRTPSAAR